MLQSGGKIAVALIKSFHRVHQLMLRLAAQSIGKIAQLLGMVDIMVEHILQQCHSLSVGNAVLSMEMLVLVAMTMVVAMLMIAAVAMIAAVLMIVAVAVVAAVLVVVGMVVSMVAAMLVSMIMMSHGTPPV